MPTDDERREVAARLRDCIVYAKKHDLDGDYVSDYVEESGKSVETRCTLYNDIASCIEEFGNFKLSAEEVFTRLAGLIDTQERTCSMDALDTGEQADYECGEYIMHCSNCNAEFGHVLYSEDGGVGMDDKPRFCPNCGARITEVD